MSIRNITTVAESDIDAAAMDEIVASLSIPPQPVVVLQMQTEMGKEEPDVQRAAQIISQDIGLTVAVLKAVNSPLYGLKRKTDSVAHAVGLIGLKQLAALVTAVSMRAALKGDTQTLTHFFDISSKRSFAIARLAREMQGVEVSHAQTFGLFCDVAIPLLMRRFPKYKETLRRAEREKDLTFTEVEHAAHHTDHALIGALMARTWGLPQNVCLAIRLHHDYKLFLDPKVPREISTLVAYGLLADAAIHRHSSLAGSVEWAKGGDYVAGALVISPEETEEWIAQLHADFAAGIH